MPPLPAGVTHTGHTAREQRVARLSLDQQTTMLAAHSSDDDDSETSQLDAASAPARTTGPKKVKLLPLNDATAMQCEDEIDDIFSGF